MSKSNTNIVGTTQDLEELFSAVEALDLQQLSETPGFRERARRASAALSKVRARRVPGPGLLAAGMRAEDLPFGTTKEQDRS